MKLDQDVNIIFNTPWKTLYETFETSFNIKFLTSICGMVILNQKKCFSKSSSNLLTSINRLFNAKIDLNDNKWCYNFCFVCFCSIMFGVIILQRTTSRTKEIILQSQLRKLQEKTLKTLNILLTQFSTRKTYSVSKSSLQLYHMQSLYFFIFHGRLQ